jgi:hypothetical protein
VEPEEGGQVDGVERADAHGAIVAAYVPRPVATGAFDASGAVASGTGRFAGATGNLRLVGIEDFTTGRFTETVRGTICLADDEDDD